MYLNTLTQYASISENLCDESIRLLSRAESQYNESIRLFRDSWHNRQKAIQSVLRTEYRRRDAIQLFWHAENLKGCSSKSCIRYFL